MALLECRYDVPFTFTGTINKLTFNLGLQQLTAEEREQMQETVARARDWRRMRNTRSRAWKDQR